MKKFHTKNSITLKGKHGEKLAFGVNYNDKIFEYCENSSFANYILKKHEAIKLRNWLSKQIDSHY